MQILIKNEMDIYQVNISDLLRDLNKEEENTIKNSDLVEKDLCNLIRISKIKNNGNQVSLRLEYSFPILSTTLKVFLAENSRKYFFMNSLNLESLLRNINVSEEQRQIILNHWNQRKEMLENNILTEKRETDSDIFSIPYNIYNKVYFSVELKYRNNIGDLLTGLTCYFNTKPYALDSTRLSNKYKLTIPNMYHKGNLCFGRNLNGINHYNSLKDVIDLKNRFLNNLFNSDLSYTKSNVNFKFQFFKNLEYIIKHKVQNTDLKNAYISILKDKKNIADNLNNLMNNTSNNIYKIIHLLYLIDI